MVLVANHKVEADNVRDLIAFAKAHPNKLNYASASGSAAPCTWAWSCSSLTKTEINQVSYRGTAPAMTDVVAGMVEVMFTGPPSAKSMSEGGKLKLWRRLRRKRMALMPEVPTVSGSRRAGLRNGELVRLVAPAKTPKAIVDRLSRRSPRRSTIRSSPTR